MYNITQIREIINDVKQLLYAIEAKHIGINAIPAIQYAVSNINSILFHTDRLRFQKEYDLNTEDEYWEYIKEIHELVEVWEQSLQRRMGKSIDIEFWDLYDYFKYVDINTIYQTVVQRFMSLPEGQRIEYLSLPYRYTFIQNKLDYANNDFSLIVQYIEMMVNNVDKYRWLYEHLADNRSKLILNRIVSYWFDFDIYKLQSVCENTFSNYYDLDILECDETDVFVDLGAFDGDTVLDYIKSYGVYKKIFAYEITPSTYQNLVQNLAKYENVIPVHKGVGNCSGTFFVNSDTCHVGNKLQECGEIKVDVVTLDEDITETISVIKMDIEGAEKDAIAGAFNHIKAEKPKLLISAYHFPADLFDIPLLIQEIRDDYRYYLRFYGQGCIWPCDYVLIAV